MSENRRTNDPEGVRRRIVDAAYDAFVTQGYLATGMLELRERASVSGGAMAHHFAVKRDLGLAVIRDRVSEAVRQTWIEPFHTGTNAPAAIDSIFESIIGGLTQNGRVSGCPLNNMAMEISQHDAEMRGAVSAVFGAWHEALSDSFETDVKENRARELNPQSLATLVIASYSGAMAMAKARQDVSPLIECRAELAALLAAKYR
ncbi:TetR family transcriptional regulator [Rhizobium sp. R339]|uniref:TetR/AcrR family transcriptional regulator n=1 Tax=Rhizobium sp. R339 TaxID=1764273 RepID=UPI000B5389E0|nr:TetR/AcrR family transcriptional regulator [Rhizobium sp. R339]OWV67035.1 TetR family transcriptional regulator [Rhizobium sp. R339]